MSECMSSIFQSNNTPLCTPLQLLLDEHGPLNEQKKELFLLAESIKENKEIEDLYEAILDLREKVLLFQGNLDPHSEKEEGYLFTMMANYIGRESGPIAVMEYEHEQAHKNIEDFLEKTSKLSVNIERNVAEELVGHIIEAFHILTSHFTKEENVLYPMAEKMLTEAEKEELLQKIKL
ncbi:hemerythrin domain-containing protein [Ferdinandcohnia quinoae]|uniref:Hemerythrin domain-containing protein n=1 Tax=Fredinandcohnia quinoae TaxID=2918902 RepID=A0AAW5E9B6_9BACI|nr:hemerythrin domain-containing protein [Fredinandcohnia sp. SECRCQ15]MCH1627574.1 hemerythrin domain-containing protein [Fredinandcohnia sp. SECRCQ15]